MPDRFLEIIGKLRKPKSYPTPGARVPVTGNGYTGSKQKVKLDKVKKEKAKKGRHEK